MRSFAPALARSSNRRGSVSSGTKNRDAFPHSGFAGRQDRLSQSAFIALGTLLPSCQSRGVSHMAFVLVGSRPARICPASAIGGAGLSGDIVQESDHGFLLAMDKLHMAIWFLLAAYAWLERQDSRVTFDRQQCAPSVECLCQGTCLGDPRRRSSLRRCVSISC